MKRTLYSVCMSCEYMCMSCEYMCMSCANSVHTVHYNICIIAAYGVFHRLVKKERTVG